MVLPTMLDPAHPTGIVFWGLLTIGLAAFIGWATKRGGAWLFFWGRSARLKQAQAQISWVTVLRARPELAGQLIGAEILQIAGATMIVALVGFGNVLLSSANPPLLMKLLIALATSQLISFFAGRAAYSYGSGRFIAQASLDLDGTERRLRELVATLTT
jgi:hypothetical protein